MFAHGVLTVSVNVFSWTYYVQSLNLDLESH